MNGKPERLDDHCGEGFGGGGGMRRNSIRNDVVVNEFEKINSFSVYLFSIELKVAHFNWSGCPEAEVKFMIDRTLPSPQQDCCHDAPAV